MCRGCFGQLLLRDEFHSSGIAGLLGKAAGMPTRRVFMAYSVAAASALPLFGAAPAFAADDGADLILRGGTIRPLPGAPVASALAIKDGKVLAVGDERALSGLKSDAKVVDLGGRTMLPGLIDPHLHTIAASLIYELLDDIGYAKYPTREKLVAHLKQEAASTPKGQWIVGANFDNLLQGGDFTRNELDAISNDHPITDFTRRIASVGNTMVHEPGTIRSDWIEPFTKLSNTLSCRTSASVMFDDMKGLTPGAASASGKARPSTIPCSRSMASKSSATAPTRPRPGRRPSPI
jgi:hypothetical protein